MTERDDRDGRTGRQPAEGVRIIKAEEAQAALEAGEATGRRPGDQLRFGDVPPAPTGPRPAHRFPLPDSLDPSEAAALPPLVPREDDQGEAPPRDRRAWRPPPPPAPLEPGTADNTDWRSIPAEEAGTTQMHTYDPESSGSAGSPGRASETEDWSDEGHWPASSAGDRTTEMGLPVPPAQASAEPPVAGITVSGSVPEMPHWSDPPTGEVPRLRFDDDAAEGDDDLGAWRALGTRGVHWRDEGDWDRADELGDLASEEGQVGALDSSRSERSDLYSFDEDFERVTSRTGSTPVVDLDEPPPQEEELVSSAQARRSTRARAAAAAASAGTGAGVGVTGRVAHRGDPRSETSGRASSRQYEPPGRRPGGGRGGGDGTPASGGELGSRVGIGTGLIVLLILAYAVGPKALLVLSTVIIAAAAAEAYGMIRTAGFRPATLLGLVGTVGCVLGAYWKGVEAIPIVTALVVVGAMLWYILGIVEARPLANVAVTVMVFAWIAVLGSFAAVMLSQPHGQGEFLGAVVVAVAADVCAFVVGRWIGSRPMAADISPHKTVEGLMGGLVGALIVGAVIGKELTPWGGMRHGLVLGLVIGLVAPVGDLFESMIKRDLGIKDSGSILGGHGGLLDRFDALLVALPAAYFVLTFFKL